MELYTTLVPEIIAVNALFYPTGVTASAIQESRNERQRERGLWARFNKKQTQVEVIVQVEANRRISWEWLWHCIHTSASLISSLSSMLSTVRHPWLMFS